LPVEHINTLRLHDVLGAAGWQADHVQEVREFDRDALRAGLAWLAEEADEDDIVFLYVAAHGKYLSDVIAWEQFFAGDWAAVPSQRRVLLVDSCFAGTFTDDVEDDRRPHLSIAAVAEDELGWCGLEEEGLPIIGNVFTHYFAAAFAEGEADGDGDARVSVQEATLWAEEQQRAYMHEVVFAVPEFLEGYHQYGFFPEKDPLFPDVQVVDALGAPLYLELEPSP
jgi:hypothetical protein